MRRIDCDIDRRHDTVAAADAKLFRISDVVKVSRAARLGVPAAIAIVVALFAALRAPARPYESLWPGVANLRTQFNADAGTVRMLILPAPT
jgi:hypothetical protein